MFVTFVSITVAMAAVSVELVCFVVLLSFTGVDLTQHVSPFFYLCSFQQPNMDQTSDDVGQVALSVTIDGDPQFYVPGQLYNGETTFFIISAERGSFIKKFSYCHNVSSACLSSSSSSVSL